MRTALNTQQHANINQIKNGAQNAGNQNQKAAARKSTFTEEAVQNGPYPSAVIAVANAETTIPTHTVSHPDRPPAREDSIFLLASITKPIVATAIMRLVEEGRLLLSDPIVRYIPEFELAERCLWRAAP